MNITLTPLAILLGALCLSILSACGGGTSTVSQPPVLREVVPESETAVDAAEIIHTSFSLKYRDSAAVETYIQQMHTLGHPNYRKVLTPGEVARRFGPTVEQVGMVTSFLQARGFSNIRVSADSLLVEADGPAGMVSRALQTKLANFAMQDGRHAFANTSAIVVPASLGAVVLDVIGLDTVTQVKTFASAASGVIGHDPTEYQSIYNVGSTPTAHNTTIGIIGVGNMDGTLADLRRFEIENGLPPTATSVKYMGDAPQLDSPWRQEMNLDSQSIVGMAGGIQKLEFYAARSNTWADILVAIAAAVESNTSRVVNMSFGSCEGVAPRAVINQYLQKAVLQGQTFVVASGDHGSNQAQCPEFSILYPASSPYVMTVGGTTLETQAFGMYGSEQAWSGSGGGVSLVESIPFWQVTVPAFAGSTRRQVPDLAYVADPDSGANIVLNGQRIKVGGTSLSAPLFVATWARMLSQCPDLGFAPPSIYAFRNLHDIMFRDITSGTNGAFRAAAAWDHVTGWGTPNVQHMWATLCPSGATYYKLAQQLYVAYLGRPLDPSGLVDVIATLKNAGAPNNIVELQRAYATNPMVRILVDCIQNSDESRAVYPTDRPQDYVAALFQSLLGRQPSSMEMAFYIDSVREGRIPYAALALTIMANIGAGNSVQGIADRVNMNNRVAIAANFTATLSPLTAISYVGKNAATSSRAMLTKVRFNSSYDFDPQGYVQPMFIVDFQPVIVETIVGIVAGRSTL
jgi:subtilase family serine protease